MKRKMDESMLWTFLKRQTVLNLATSVQDNPYSASCFYYFNKKLNYLVFKSSEGTKHIQNIYRQEKIAGTILPDKLKLGNIRGVQFQGKIIFPNKIILSTLSKKYHSKYPYGLSIPGEIFVIELNYIKMTNNKFGFGNKLIWSK